MTTNEPPIQRKSVDLSGVTLSYLEAGHGDPLVFVHGSVTTSELFRETIARFAPSYRVIAVDLRGYGASSKPANGYTMQGSPTISPRSLMPSTCRRRSCSAFPWAVSWFSFSRFGIRLA